MASAKKKLDEYHLKILRQLVTLPGNKECFDCHQRGPTYVNVTIGSFVCTTCSGMLRGLTPPHRVKSISMATFTPEEVDFVKARGNEYCRRVWLGLCDTQLPTKDEQQIKDFMIAKYERKRYYLDPSVAPTVNGNSSGNMSPASKPSTPSAQTKVQSTVSTPVPLPAPSIAPHLPSLNVKNNTSQVNNNNNINSFTSEPLFNADFSNLANVTPSDPFSSVSQANSSSVQASFANFDNNPIFSNMSSSSTGVAGVGEAAIVPSEDRYAALKDLDCQMKSQQQQQQQQQGSDTQTATQPDWTGNGITNVWSAPSVFSPLPGQTTDNKMALNPFTGGEGTWGNVNSFGANPFRSTRPEVVWPAVANGQIPNGFPTSQSLNFAPSKVQWNSDAISNPFVHGSSSAHTTTGHHSSNPFL